MKSLIISAWLLAVGILEEVGRGLSTVSGLIEWSQVGWAFGASTAFVIYEITQKIARPGLHRAGLVGIGMLVSLGLGPWLSDLTKVPITPMTILLGAGGYKLFDWFVKKKLDDPEKSIKDLTGLNKE